MLCSFVILHHLSGEGEKTRPEQVSTLENMFRRQGLACSVSASGDIYSAVSSAEMRHTAGEKTFIFSAAQTIEKMDPETDLETICKEHLQVHSYAAGCYEAQTQKISFCSDPAGGQRIWYYRTEEYFACSNDLALLRLHPSFPYTLSPQQIWDYVSLLYVPSGSIYKDVYCLPPGKILYWDGKARSRNTEESSALPENSHKNVDLLSYERSCAELERLLKESVDKVFERTCGDHVGVFLSGGIDSAILGGLAAQKIRGPLHCCSIAFKVREYDERENALKSAAHLRRVTGKEIVHHIEEINAPSDFSFLADLIGRYGQPFADSSLIPSALLCRFAPEYADVFLGGDGADELFRGYERYIAMRYLERFDVLPSFLRKGLFKTMQMCLPAAKGNTERTRTARICRLLKAGEKERANRYFSLVSHSTEEIKKRLFTESFTEEMIASEDTFDVQEYFKGNTDPSFFDIKTYLPGDCLTKTYIASKGTGLTVECPFLTREVMEFALQLPAVYKEKNRYRKRILCDTFGSFLYEGLARGKKRGFGVPLAHWMRREWKQLLAETLLDGTAVKQGIFSSHGTETLLKEHAMALADHSYLLYCALILELFLRQGSEDR